MPHEKELSTRWILGWMAWAFVAFLLLGLVGDVVLKSKFGDIFSPSFNSSSMYDLDDESLYDDAQWFEEMEFEDMNEDELLLEDEE
jgi:hypothetical protein